MATATRQMLDAVGRARSLAISQRTTVYMVFVPALSDAQKSAPANLVLVDKQQDGYAFVTLRSLGDQPGRSTPHYLSDWKALPDGSYIVPQKFQPFNPLSQVMSIPNLNPGGSPAVYQIYGFPHTNTIPFPTETDPHADVPYIAFDSLGRLASQRDEFIPLAKGNLVASSLNYTEQPAGNSISNYNIIKIEWLTGRAHLERREIQ